MNLTDIETALQEALLPTTLVVEDESLLHQGHWQGPSGIVTHIRVLATSPRFLNTGRLEQHRLVNTILKPFFSKGLHAAKLTLHAPQDS